jgi:hypothetical protein
MNPTIEGARAFVTGIELPSPTQRRSPLEDEAEIHLDFDEKKVQALVVGSDIISFVKGVTPEQRQDILNSSLLAQLAAKKIAPASGNIYRWYDKYFDVLTNIGWVLQQRGFAAYTERSKDFAAHEAILDIAASLLGPQTAALEIIKATLAALEKMETDSPWITLFNRESQVANAARFQICLAEPGTGDQFLVSMMAFGLEARSQLTQVLFAKFTANEATLKYYSTKISINSLILTGVRDEIVMRIKAFTRDYVAALPDLG